jgi:hypothetical protein
MGIALLFFSINKTYMTLSVEKQGGTQGTQHQANFNGILKINYELNQG